ncbi:tetratricopeptide repeat protein [Marinobacter salicampi]|uniref:tetratricopeptide repeat protein n=1 Tax=Marinobacter salicampi TaxID=435907 RepID=UPI0014075FDF|nr:sel1 repeat family protein [Marinobacter salicampi]
MRPYSQILRSVALIILTILTFQATQASQTTQVQQADDQTRIARDMIRTLEAYAVYKMGQYDLAFERYLALAEDGNRQGMMNVANMYAEGKGVEQSDSNAYQWNLRLAESGDRIGMAAVAQAYRTGRGVEQDSDRARFWDTRAGVKE